MQEVIHPARQEAADLHLNVALNTLKRLTLLWKEAGVQGNVRKDVDSLLHRLNNEILEQHGGHGTPERATIPWESIVELTYLNAASAHQLTSTQLEGLANQLDKHMHQISLQDACTLVWSLAQLDPPEQSGLAQCLSTLLAQVLCQLQESRFRMKLLPQDLSNLITGYASVAAHPDSALLVAVANAAQRILPDFNTTCLADLIWATAEILGQGETPPPEVAMLVERIPGEFLHQLMHNSSNTKVSSKAICRLLWSYATLSIAPKKLMAALALDIHRRLHEYSLEDVVNIAWAFAHLEQYPGPGLMEGIVDLLRTSLSSMSVGQAACLLWACAVQRHHPSKPTLAALLSKLRREVSQMRPQELGRAMWANAQLGFTEALPLLEEGVRLASTWLSGCSVQDVWRIAWAAAVFEKLTVEDVALLAGKHADVPPSSYPPLALQAISEVVMLGGERAAACLPGGLLDAARQHCRRLLLDSPTSKAQRDLATAVAGLGMPHVPAHVVADGLLRIDVALPDSCVALLLEPAASYMSNLPHQPTGRTLLRWHLLGRLGWKVQTVPAKAWTDLVLQEARTAYVAGILSPSVLSATDYAQLPHNLFLMQGGEAQGSQHREEQGTTTSFSRVLGTWSDDNGTDLPAISSQPALSGFSVSASADVLYAPAPCDRLVELMDGLRLMPGVSRGDPSSSTHYNPPAAVGGEEGSGFSKSVEERKLRPGREQTDERAVRAAVLDGAKGSATWDAPDCGTAATVWGEGGSASGEGGSAADPQLLKDIRQRLELESLDLGASHHLLHLLHRLPTPHFPLLLQQLADDNRFWKLFEIVRQLPANHELSRFCTVEAYITVIKQCGVRQQMGRGLDLLCEMHARHMKCPPQMYYALFKASLQSSNLDVAIEIFNTMGSHAVPRHATVYQALAEGCHSSGQVAKAVDVLQLMHSQDLVAEVSFYNTLLMTALKADKPHFVLHIFQMMGAAKVEATSKSYGALISACSRLGDSIEEIARLICGLLGRNAPSPSTQSLNALMAACEKAGQFDLAIAIFERLISQGHQPDVSIFNSMIAACAHGGEYNKARLLFAKITEHGCQPDAVSFANLIRAYKKGGQWCNALATYEAMQASGRRPHAAVHSSVIDVLWQTGIPWAQQKAVSVFTSSIQAGSLPTASETYKKGTLKVDLQALTVGVAVLAMTAWLFRVASSLRSEAPSSLDSARKLAVVNGLGEHSRAQGHSALVKEAVYTNLMGCGAPFRLVPDHSRSGRLEASTLALCKWLVSTHFQHYLHVMQWREGPVKMSTAEYLQVELSTAALCDAHYAELIALQGRHEFVGQALAEAGPVLLAHRKQLVLSLFSWGQVFHFPLEVVHTAAALLDRVLAHAGSLALAPDMENVLLWVLFSMASQQECVPLPPAVHQSIYCALPLDAAQHVERSIRRWLNEDTRAYAPFHFLKVYLRRLGYVLNGQLDADAAVLGTLDLATEALQEVGLMTYQPSVAAAAILICGRTAWGLQPAWPSVLAQLTGYTEAGTPRLAAAVADFSKLTGRSAINPTLQSSLYLSQAPGLYSQQHFSMHPSSNPLFWRQF